MSVFDLKKETRRPSDLERMLVAIDDAENCHVVIAKGYWMEVDVQDNGIRDPDEMGISLPESGIPGILAVFESRPRVSGGGYNSYNGDYDDVEIDYEDHGCRWRTLTDAEWGCCSRGDLEGLRALWDDIKDRYQVEVEWIEASGTEGEDFLDPE